MGPRAAGRWSGVAAAAALVCACDVPPRPDSWRPAEDPEPAPRRDGGAAALIAEERARARDSGRRDETLTIHLDRQPKHLNPLRPPSTWTLRIAHGPIFEPLLRHVPPAPDGRAARYEPALARSVNVSPDGLSIRIELREDVRFHDGTPLTAADVAFSLEAARSGRGGAEHLRKHLADVRRVEDIGDRTLRIRLLRPSAYAMRALSQVPILPEHIYEGALGSEPEEVIGTGPYRVEAWDEKGVRLLRFSDYWGEAAETERVDFRYVADAAEALAQARDGEIDIMPSLMPAHVEEQLEAPGFAADFAELRLRPPTLTLLALHARREPLRDPRVRRALALAVGRGAIISELRSGLARIAPGPVWPGGPVHGPFAVPFVHDPRAAGKLFDAAGWHLGEGGLREREGETLRLSLLATEEDDPLRARIVEDLREAGVEVRTRGGSPAVLRRRIRAADFDLALVEWRGEVDRDPAALLDGAFSPEDPELSASVERLRKASSAEERADAAAALARATARAVPFVPLIAPEPRGLRAARVRGVRIWDGWFDLARVELASESRGFAP